MLLYGCGRNGPKPDPHYVLGGGYQVNGVWFYPAESYDLNETGLAIVMTGPHPPLTSDGEVFDPTALAAGHPTLQLPAIAQVTNLENGRQITVRINDRGPGDPRRLIALTPRAATLLGMADTSVTQVRLQVLGNPSRAAVDGVPGAPKLALNAVPRDAVQVAALPPLPGTTQVGGVNTSAQSDAAPAEAADAPPPMRLPEAVVQTPPRPGQLIVRLDTFETYVYAAVQQAKLAAYGAHIISYREGRDRHFRVEVGPLQDVAQADRVLLQAFASGIPDARIVVE